MSEQQQISVQVGRTQNGLVAIAKNNEISIALPPRVALQLAAQLVKHSSIILAGATMIDDAILQVEQEEAKKNGGNRLESRTDSPEVPPVDENELKE